MISFCIIQRRSNSVNESERNVLLHRKCICTPLDFSGINNFTFYCFRNRDGCILCYELFQPSFCLRPQPRSPGGHLLHSAQTFFFGPSSDFIQVFSVQKTLGQFLDLLLPQPFQHWLNSLWGHFKPFGNEAA